ncbi:hypothetical protein SCHPADRAFT_885079 [Schizopora paradoxa]|uniref:Uncharacterized protein n=1 Tax=Schizopora paradoxa TaxID=27342 RepID=A0A0H2S6A9_9AGAM|nr:hypothetical protein SCHPADRAFT_885079 [Schizopora paradoxa]
MSGAHSFILTYSDMPVMEAQRRTLEKTDMLMHITKMQLNVLDQTTKRKRTCLNGFALERTNVLSHLNDNLDAHYLPTLPNEIIAHIFLYLYWLEKSVYMKSSRDEPQQYYDSWTIPVQLPLGRKSFVNNYLLWFEFLMTVTDISREIKDLVGPHPTIFSMDQLDVQEVLEKPSTTLFVILSDRLDLKESLERLGEHDEPAETLQTLLKNFGYKLMALTRLELFPSIASDDRAPSPKTFATSGEGALAHERPPERNLTVVRAPASLLPSLRPFLNNITILKTDISHQRTSDFKLFVDFLASLHPCSGSLASLAINFPEPHRLSGVPYTSLVSTTTHRRQKSVFPVLKRLEINALPDYMFPVVLSIIDCPRLLHLSLGCMSVDANGLLKDNFSLTLTSVHDAFPVLESITLRLPNEICTQFLHDLAKPDAGKNWPLPLLRTIDVGLRSGGSVHLASPTWEALLAIVVNRLKSGETKNIHSIPMPYDMDPYKEYTITNTYFEAVKLLVPMMFTRLDGCGRGFFW